MFTGVWLCLIKRHTGISGMMMNSMTVHSMIDKSPSRVKLISSIEWPSEEYSPDETLGGQHAEEMNEGPANEGAKDRSSNEATAEASISSC
jgi:hypothetical protein